MPLPTFYHGTSTSSGLEAGDYLDPRRGNYEPVVWGTASIKHARRFARDVAAVRGGDPVIFEVKWRPDADVVVIRESDDILESIEQAKENDADLLVIERGENGQPEIAVLRPGIAWAEMVSK